ncbi:MAG: YgfZ/GcvT domain-containing protein [Acidimicrobiales bacterium]
MLDLSAALSAATTGVVAVRTRRDVIEASGPDAATYLHGQLSQDVVGLAIGGSAPTLLLQPQGKVDAWLRITRLDESTFWLDVDPGYGDAAMARLERFKLRVDAQLALTERPMVALRGPAALSAAEAGLPAGNVTVAPLGSGVVGLDLLGPDAAVPEDVDEGPAEALEVLRIRHAVPAMGAELDGDTIPAAAGIVPTSVDFTKGCYVGQELVARIDSRGNNTPTRLHVLRLVGPPVAAGTDLVLAGEVIGRLTSAVAVDGGSVGLGYIKRGVDVPVTAVAVGTDGREIAVEVLAVP